jgi:hypothetical protein
MENNRKYWKVKGGINRCLVGLLLEM